MYDLWTPKYDKYWNVWVTKTIDLRGITLTTIYKNNTVITPYESTLSKIIVKNPEPYIRQKYGIEFDKVLAVSIDIVNNVATIVHKKNNEVFVDYFTGESHYSDRAAYPLPRPCDDTTGYKYFPELFYTLVKKSNGYLKIKRCIQADEYSYELYALWRPGTYLYSIDCEPDKPVLPENAWPMTNMKYWYEDEIGIHSSNAKGFRIENTEYEFVLDAENFSVLHLYNGIDLVVTPKVTQKIYTGARTPKELFIKIFTGDFTVL